MAGSDDDIGYLAIEAPSMRELSDEALKLHLEEEDSLSEQIDAFLAESLQDFPDEDNLDDAARYAAEIARAVIADKTRWGHLRIVKAYIVSHKRKDPNRDPKAVTASTLGHITQFIILKCGDKYRSIHPNESITDWRIDKLTGECFGLPTRSCHVSEFMTGLEKTKAKAGEVSNSVQALSLSDMHNLYDHCFRPNATPAQIRWGIVRYVGLSTSALINYEKLANI
ncbi:hypothetical protein B0H17DRAFT_1142367 [Mycena rosella]|uniref:Uncharacterized protein n=1 Tax=Mycena rosella TaxID=1033263 RepID=A0AAD7CXC2_MYCRO|nr:hypothetical protein B0H17DRAFT_1142367 [Mycena rosella]